MRLRNWIFYILIFLGVAALALLIYLRLPGSEPDTPPVLLPTTSAGETPTPEQPDSVSSQTIRVDAATVQTVIGTLRRSDSYSRSLAVERFWSGGGSRETYNVWVRGESVRITVRSTGQPDKNVLLRDGKKWVWYSDGGAVYSAAASADDADAYQSLLRYEDVLALPQSSITDAGYVDYAGEQCIFVRYTDGPLNYEHHCYISVKTGLLMGQETYDGETLIYRMQSGAPDISTPNESMFEIPKS